MELRVLSDDGDVLHLQVVARNVQSDAPPRFESLEEMLGPQGYARRALLSLAETRFIDSGGLSWLVVCHKRFCQGGGRFVVHSITPNIRELLHMMRLDQALYVADDEAAALQMAKAEKEPN
jgi:anti-anti-sigma factor